MAILPDISNLPRSAANPAVRIERYYTQQILTGAIPPGTRLPSSNDIARHWSVSATVVQKAMHRMSIAGLVARERKSGTIVCDRNERAMIGMVIGPSLADETAHHYRALATELEALLSQEGFACRIYDGVHPNSLPASRDYQPIDMLKTDMVYYPFKGIILISTGQRDVESLFPRQLPCVRLEYGPGSTSDLRNSAHDFLYNSLHWLSHRGHRRTLIVSSIAEQNTLTIAQRVIPKIQVPANLSIDHLPLCTYKGRGYHMEKLGFDSILEAVKQWEANPELKPDSLIVTDDIIARGVCMGLLKSQIAVPEEMKIIISTSESVTLHYGMPVIRYEYSLKEKSRAIISLLWKRMAGEAEPKLPISFQGKLVLPDSLSSAH